MTIRGNRTAALSECRAEGASGLATLTWLGLSNTKVTDAGLGELKGLKNLEQLYLYRTEVTDQGLKELKKVLPRCRSSR